MIIEIGSERELIEDMQIEAPLSKAKINIKKGAKGYVTSQGWLRFTTGEAKGKMIKLDDDHELSGYDNENIALIITNRLESYFDIGNILEEYGIAKKDFINEIESVLDDIL